MAIRFLCVLSLLIATLSSAFAETDRRVALVIGNAGYSHVPLLANPANDATDIAAALKRLDFDVTLALDADDTAMQRLLRDFAGAAREADLSLVYYAGHGIEVDQTNYLIPVNAELRRDLDVDFEALPLDLVMQSLVGAGGLKIVLIDACRDNPFAAQLQLAKGTRSIGTGLGRVDPIGGVRAGGILVGYAAREGTVALDGAGRNSPYAAALLEYLEEPGLEISQLFRKVRDRVFDLTGGAQEPFTYGALPSGEFFLGEASVQPAVALAPPVSPQVSQLNDELSVYSAAEKLGSLRGWALYFDQFPRGRLEKSAIAREEQQLMNVIQSRVFGRYRGASETAALDNELRKSALGIFGIGDELARDIQSELKDRGNQIGVVDGQIGARTMRALAAVQAANRLPITGLPTRATLSVLGQIGPEAPAADLSATSGPIAKVIDRDAAALLEGDPRLDRLLQTFHEREIIYGYFGGRLYAAVYLGTTIGEPDLARYNRETGGALVEITTAAEQEFVSDLVRYDRKLWTRGNSGLRSDYGPTIGLSKAGGRLRWRSGAALAYSAPVSTFSGVTSSEIAYGRLVPDEPLSKDARIVGRVRWAMSLQPSHSIILEIE
ncbi:caspase family protein [Aliiruegeria lutimaris]|uniref:Uncharacterized protein, contains caspase domain n=1 Tax=Aliiruegeria lutimaris TaxID=571298 RepID=A0A1G9B6E9_9RHOB|nr:caspase family protein [Aliiruegeria lutimaris]SDK35101.1 Uncharacterized protein, contains caspase domain [Aliiruegeria lutimaris]